MRYGLSVIIPVYNAEKYLENCLDSLERQSYGDFEVLLVDDGSEDSSGAICDGYAERNQSWRVLHKKNEGVMLARNAGIRLAQGEYIGFIDADDWVEERFLETFMRHVKHSRADIVAGGCVRIWKGESRRLTNNLSPGIYDKEILKNFYEKMLCWKEGFAFGVLPYMWNKVFRREILLSVIEEADAGVYDGEDVMVNNLCMLKAERIELIEDFSYHYTLRGDSVTLNKKKDFYANVSRLYLCLYEAFQKSRYQDILLPQLDSYMRMMIRQSAPEGYAKRKEYQFPFSKVRPESKVVLYAAGKVGQAFYRQIKKTEYCKIAAWIDKNYRSSGFTGMNIQPISALNSLEYDKIILAVESGKLAEEIGEELQKYGIRKEKLLWCDYVL